MGVNKERGGERRREWEGVKERERGSLLEGSCMGWSHLRRIKGMEVKRREKLKKLLQKIQWKACTAIIRGF